MIDINQWRVSCEDAIDRLRESSWIRQKEVIVEVDDHISTIEFIDLPLMGVRIAERCYI